MRVVAGRLDQGGYGLWWKQAMWSGEKSSEEAHAGVVECPINPVCVPSSSS